MKKNHRAQKSQFTIFGYLLFFILVSFVATCSILAYTIINELSGENKLITSVLTLVVLIVLTLACTFIDYLRRKYTIANPVQQILDATEAIANGDFSVKISPLHAYGKYDEFDIIIDNINLMAKELSKNEVLRTDFIANVSHEIKTPLSIIESYVDGLQNDKLSNETRGEYVQTLLSASRRLTELVTNILKLNKLENQEIFPKKTKIALGEHLREIIIIFEDKIEQKQIDLSCDIDDVDVQSDAGFLEIVWSNLLSNAIKFTDKCGKISVSLKEMYDCVQVTISDSGCGISQETGARIFDKFYQGDTSHATEGNGLGLALVKRVIDMLGGEIIVISESGKGSSFQIKIMKEVD